MTRSGALALSLLPALAMAGAACTLDFDKYDPAAISSDASSPEDAGTDATIDHAIGSDASDGGMAAREASGSNEETGGGPACGASCLEQAGQCGAPCQTTLGTCTSACQSSRCRQQCQTTAQACVDRCTRTCDTCWSSAGCSGSNDCADASATD